MNDNGGVSLFIVRMVDSHDVVGLFAAHDEAHLYDIVDECCEALWTEYREIKDLAIYWPGPAFPVPVAWEDEPAHIENYTKDAILSDGAFDELGEDGEWRLFKGGTVYILEAGGRFKIGYSADVNDRIRNLQTACPFPLRLVATIPGTIEDERRYHKHFAEYRKTGEWFELPDGVLPLLQSKGWAIE